MTIHLDHVHITSALVLMMLPLRPHGEVVQVSPGIVTGSSRAHIAFILPCPCLHRSGS